MDAMPDTNISVFTAALLLVLSLIYIVWVSRPAKLSRYVPGPPSPSWVAGHIVDIWRNQKQSGDLEFSWFRKYGATIKIKGTFGTDILMTSDPKALQHIIHTSNYRFQKSEEIIVSVLRPSTGNGILSVQGTTHQRHRKVFSPTFAETQVRGFLPLFQRIGKELTSEMIDAMDDRSEQVFNMHRWLGRASLDIIGEAAFGHRFNSLQNENCEMSVILYHLLDNASAMSKPLRVVIWALVTFPTLQGLLQYSPHFFEFHRTILKFQEIAKGIASKIVDDAKTSQSTAMHTVEGKDVLSILVRANQSDDPTRRLDSEEVLSQAATLLSAGQETSASTLAWVFYELSSKPDIQAKIRTEIAEARAHRCDEELTTQDYDGMYTLNAVIKETLRMYPILGKISRQAVVDEIIPLSEPIFTADGGSIDAIPVQKGQLIECAIHGYNRNPAVWGPDADVWRPERWGEQLDKNIPLGLFGNLLTFSGGVRGCIGWRFAVTEMQTVAAELLEKFHFGPSEDLKDVRRWPGFLLTPRLAGRLHEGAQMPLTVAPLE
ncbi:cytochrome P450 [Cylindrobasidium torrendii FP15055 ss-10]|uniref:Cytochrome P450 n=1 Tax=Cylindrobasidium torrendii FP15055 ss-10 TaxID=1314674 RepID=A0A0D7B4Q5_9AGAR|nr:cytochrome P450 [Cylindrobasidium torrendii FP15055 ss-10]